MAFSKLKALLRKRAARSFDTITNAFGDIISFFSVEGYRNFFKAAGMRLNRCDAPLGVQPRHLMDRIDDEAFWFYCRSFADDSSGVSPSQCLETAEVTYGNEALEMGSELVMVVIVEALDGRVLDCAVHALNLAVGP